MELHCECVHLVVVDALAGIVIRVDKADFADRLHRFVDNLVTVVLAGDVYPARLQIFDRLVGTAVTVFHLLGLAAHREREELMPQADTKYGKFAGKFFDIFNDTDVFGGVARAVGEHQPVRFQCKNLLGAPRCGSHIF